MAHYDYYHKTKDLNDVFYNSHEQLIENVCTYLNMSDKVQEIKDKFLDEKIKLKAKKDINMPVGPRTAYLLFSNQVRPEVIKKLPGQPLPVIAKELGRMWRELDTESRTKYTEFAYNDKKRYDEEIAKYKQQIYQCPL